MYMSRTKPDIQIGGVTWKHLGSGSFNDAYVATITGGKKLVYKIPKASISPKGEYSPQEREMDTPERAIRLWNEINPEFEAEKYKKGWVAPFIEGTDPSVTEICYAIVDIYQKTGRVLADAMTPGNLKKLNNTDKVVCVDVGAALKLERELEDEKSQVSLDFWKDMKLSYDRYFNDPRNYPVELIGDMTKALLVLQQFRPDVRDVSLLKNDSSLVSSLADAYRTSKLPGDIYSIFPINLDYFSKIPLLKDIIFAENISDDHKQQLCQLYQLKKFSNIHKELFLLLLNTLTIDVLNAIAIIQNNNIEQAGILFRGLSSEIKSNTKLTSKIITLGQEGKLTQDSYAVLDILDKANLLTEAHFNEVKSHTDLTSLAKAVSALSKANLLTEAHFNDIKSNTNLTSKIITLGQEGKLTQDSYAVLDILNKANLLTEANFNEVKSHTDLTSLAKAVSALSKKNLLTEANFNLTSLDTNVSVHINGISNEKTNKEIVKSFVDNAVLIVKNSSVNSAEKIKKLCDIANKIMNSCLKNESGILGMGFFSKTGKTKSYQDAMGKVKTALLEVLENEKPGNILEKDIILAKNILSEHVGRGLHVMGTKSISNNAFLKHERFYEETERFMNRGRFGL